MIYDYMVETAHRLSVLEQQTAWNALALACLTTILLSLMWSHTKYRWIYQKSIQKTSKKDIAFIFIDVRFIILFLFAGLSVWGIGYKRQQGIEYAAMLHLQCYNTFNTPGDKNLWHMQNNGCGPFVITKDEKFAISEPVVSPKISEALAQFIESDRERIRKWRGE